MRFSPLPGIVVASLALSLTAAASIAQTTAPQPGQQQLGPQQTTSTATPGTSTDVGNTTVTGSTTTTTDAQGNQSEGATLSFGKKKKTAKDDKVVASKDTVKANKRDAKLNPLAGKDANLPDKALYDKAEVQEKSGHYDVARLDLETLLNTYPDSQYQMRAKLAIADSWYRQGDTASLTQAEQEYNDFITFFPNVPEAAEAQMRVGDIYFKQLDVPDRDYQKAVKAEDAYRLMLKQYPDSTLVPDARQKLREVQEILATREAEIAAFYGGHANWAASIARYQTVVDTYPQYSHMDDVLIGIGDAYAAQSRYMRSQNIGEGPKSQLVQTYDGRAAAEYRKVVLEHAAAPHAEDAKERLAAMGLAIPEPTAEQRAASEELEGSRAQYNLQRRLALLFLKRPDVVTAARVGEPPLEDPAATTAPQITQQMLTDYASAFNPSLVVTKTVIAAPVSDGSATAAPLPASNAPLALSDVGTAAENAAAASDTSVMSAAPASSTGSASGASLGVEVLTPGATTHSAATSATLPAATGAQDPNNGLKAVGPANTEALPPVEKADAAPDQVNDAAGKPQQPGQVAAPGTNAKAPALDKDDESSSKHKPKKGVDKLNPF